MKPFTALTVALLGLICVLQLTRFLLGWTVAINGADEPLWISPLAAVVAGALAFGLWRESRH